MLKQHIRESFFNPVLHLFPLLLFLFLNDVTFTSLAWIISTMVGLLILVYVYWMYRSLGKWYVVSLAFFLMVALVVTYLSLNPPDEQYGRFVVQIVVKLLLLTFVLLKKPMLRWVNIITPGRISMKNNLNELIRLVTLLIIVMAAYSLVSFLTMVFVTTNADYLLTFYYQMYLFLMIMVVIYEFIRVSVIRSRLMREDWLPIVNEQGREMGSINYHISMKTECDKYRHPIVRVFLLENNMLLLRQHHAQMGDDALKWDIAISRHRRMGETVESCIRKASTDLYQIDTMHPVFIGNYPFENECEFQYVYLYIACSEQINITPNLKYMERCKWWTLQQINENLSTGIFTQNFILEYDMLKRSGLIDSDLCQCDGASLQEFD